MERGLDRIHASEARGRSRQRGMSGSHHGVSVALRRLVWLAAVLLLASCSSGRSGGTAQDGDFTDPFAYCKAVGTIDAPDQRYTGPEIPMAVAVGLRDAFDLPQSAPLEPFLRGTYWRCMDGDVYACNVGANLPCQEKANTSRTPTPPMVQFCATNADAEVIPAAVTGRATVYLWRCQEGRPEIVRQVSRPDERGFIENYWHKIEPDGKG